MAKQATENHFFPIWRCSGSYAVVSPEMCGEPPSKSINQGMWAVRIKCGLSLETQFNRARALSWALRRGHPVRTPTEHTQRPWIPNLP